MNQLKLGINGWEKSGKTVFCASALESQHIDPKKVIYFDNHNSTSALSLHQHSKVEPWGVWHTGADPVQELIDYTITLRRLQARGRPMPMLHILDDATELGLASIDDLNMDSGDDEKARMRNWGTHLTNMTRIYRGLKNSGSHLIIVTRAGWGGDPKQKRDKGSVVDNRDQVVRPMLQGAFGDYIPFELDAVLYQEMERAKRGGGRTYTLHFTPPDADTFVVSRYETQWEEKSLPKEVQNATFDQVWDLFTQVKG